MKKTFVVSLLASVALLGASGCASDQGQKPADTSTPEAAKKPDKPKDNRPIDQRLTVGMTMDQVRDAIGNPKGTAVSSDGEQTWTYSDAEKAFIPYYSLSGGKFHHVVVTFDKDGKVKSWSSNTQGGY
jgi:outer membrane protein assembly factor BamE (lipoprotein component of BamABCDE complex)